MSSKKKLKRSLADVRGKLRRAEKKLAKARERTERWKKEAKAQRQSAIDGPTAESPSAEAVTVPDESWTVVQLRAEARARGLAGMSSKSKGQLLAALS